MADLPPRGHARAGAEDYLSQPWFYHDIGRETSVRKTNIAHLYA
jgi:hypothetical protein